MACYHGYYYICADGKSKRTQQAFSVARKIPQRQTTLLPDHFPGDGPAFYATHGNLLAGSCEASLPQTRASGPS